MNPKRIVATISKEWREITRDKLFLTLAFVSPVLIMLVFGYGMNMDVENIPIVILDQDNTPQSRDYAHRYIHSRYFDFRGYVKNEHDIAHLILNGEIRAAIIIPEHFSKRLAQGRPVAVQTILDGTIPLRTSMTKGYIIAINANVNRDRMAEFLSAYQGIPLEAARRRIEGIRLESRYLYNQGMKSIWSMTPKLIMVILMMAPPFLTAVAVVREKERGSIFNIYSSTVSKAEFLIGKLTPYTLITLIDGLLLWVLVTQLYGAPFKGSFPFFLLATAAYALCTTGMGLLVSLFVTNQLAAVVITMLVTVIPATLYSGIMVPLSAMGPMAKSIAYIVPAMYYAKIIDGAFLKGQGLADLWFSLVQLFFYGAALFFIGHAIFTKRPRK